MEQMLSAFQCDLSSISSEIQTLQEQSVAMNLRLKNRQAVRSQLSQLVDELVVPATMISTILETPVTEQEFLEQLHELNSKINYVKEQAFRETMACADVQHVLEKLKVKAVTKIREFVLQKIYSFRKPMTNYQIPQNALLKYRFFYQFLLGNERAVAQELREQYVETMSKIYLSYFKSYTSRLMKIQYEEVAEKDDLMGVEDTAKKGFFSKPSLKNRNTIFTLGNRGAVIGAAELEGPIIVPHTAQKSDVRYPFESLFRSQHYALLDNSCREYLFLCDFFMVTGPSAQDLFNAVMGKTLTMFLKHMDAYACDCYDSIAIFLCIHIVLRFRAIMAKRNIPAVDKYWETLLEILWPRFEYVLELNIQSIQNTDPQKLGFLDTRPHYITRRYAEFSSAIVSINQTFPNEKTHALLGQLQVGGAGWGPGVRGGAQASGRAPVTPVLPLTAQVEVENFVLRVAAEFSSRKEQLIFLINNYDMMLGVLMVTSPPHTWGAAPHLPSTLQGCPPPTRFPSTPGTPPEPAVSPGAGGGGEQGGGGLPAAAVGPHPGVHRGDPLAALRRDDRLRQGVGGAHRERAAGAAARGGGPGDPAGARLLQHLEGLGGGPQPGRHEVLQQLQERHQHHPGRPDAADPVLPPLPQGAVAAAAARPARPHRAHQHPPPHGGAQEAQAQLLRVPGVTPCPPGVPPCPPVSPRASKAPVGCAARVSTASVALP
uniref:Vacuolar protein sorting-associated protein 52 homolog n=1 Tax=Dromaius novaehollandiae TaxID=8790 RepID=A0A8C4JRE0_DRONO